MDKEKEEEYKRLKLWITTAIADYDVKRKKAYVIFSCDIGRIVYFFGLLLFMFDKIIKCHKFIFWSFMNKQMYNLYYKYSLCVLDYNWLNFTTIYELTYQNRIAEKENRICVWFFASDVIIQYNCESWSRVLIEAHQR